FKQYDLASANKKIDLINPLCPPASKIIGEILRQHPFCYALIAVSSIPWIYMQQLWHTLKLDDSKDKFKFMVDDEGSYVLNSSHGKVRYNGFTSTMTDTQENPYEIPNNKRNRTNEPYHKVENDKVMRIPEWLLTEEMKQTKDYKVYAAEFQIVVSIT
ncbi:hypothetical protein Tco_1421872, partial [Tanacetum coccineum]